MSNFCHDTPLQVKENPTVFRDWPADQRVKNDFICVFIIEADRPIHSNLLRNLQRHAFLYSSARAFRYHRPLLSLLIPAAAENRGVDPVQLLNPFMHRQNTQDNMYEQKTLQEIVRAPHLGSAYTECQGAGMSEYMYISL